MVRWPLSQEDLSFQNSGTCKILTWHDKLDAAFMFPLAEKSRISRSQNNLHSKGGQCLERHGHSIIYFTLNGTIEF